MNDGHDRTDVPQALTEKILESRKRLQREKPRVYDKLMAYLEREKEPDRRSMCLIDFGYNFNCNFNCQHCSAEFFQQQHADHHLTMDDVQKIMSEADAMGVFIINLIGGEPLIWPDLDELIHAINPNRFFITITTNGWLLTLDRAKHLAQLGVNKMNVSIDSGIAEEHDAFRQKKGAFDKAMEAVRNSLAAGLNTQISTVATHQNIHTEGFERLMRIAHDLNIYFDIQCATPSGKWLGNTDALLDENDAKYLRELRVKFPLIRRDVYSTPGSIGGCPAVTGSLFLISTGDVMPCLFIHTSLGNALQEPLAVIRDRGLQIPEFKEYSSVCLAGEDCPFFRQYMTKTFAETVFPVPYQKIYGDLK